MKKYYKKSAFICVLCSILYVMIFTHLKSFANVYAENPTYSEKINYIREQKKQRMESLKEIGITMEKYTVDCEDSELERRFERFSYDRWRVYFSNLDDYGKPDAVGTYKELYKMPENWQSDWKTRHEFPFAFEYNIAYKQYDASIILSDRNSFLALEAPSSKNINEFYCLMDQYDIDYFVKLNDPVEYSEDYYPFWEESKVNEDNKMIIGKRNHLELFSYIWPHRKAGDIKSVINIVTNIYDNNPHDMIAVSCRAGAGRTGTFIAAYILIDEINHQLENGTSKSNIDISIDKIIWELTVQRAYAITHCSQYINLYRIADFYLSTKS